LIEFVTLKKHGLNFFISRWACGDYLQVADQVILVNNYLPENATAKAKLINEQNPPLSKLAEEENVVLPLHFLKVVLFNIHSAFVTPCSTCPHLWNVK
jgi:hypothetical protein